MSEGRIRTTFEFPVSFRDKLVKFCKGRDEPMIRLVMRAIQREMEELENEESA